MVKPVSIRLSEDLTRRLSRVADVVERPRSYLIRKAVEGYLDEYADSQVALDRLRDKDDKIRTAKEMKKRLGL
jgi:RHH-type rel operon transcriptional repressor/antitoxin RelB